MNSKFKGTKRKVVDQTQTEDETTEIDLPSEEEETKIENPPDDPIVHNRMIGASHGVSFSLLSRG